MSSEKVCESSNEAIRLENASDPWDTAGIHETLGSSSDVGIQLPGEMIGI